MTVNHANHIVFLCSYLNVPGGYEKSVVTTANLFAEKSNRVSLVILDETAGSYYPLHKNINVIHERLFFGITNSGNVLTRKISLVTDVLKLRKLLKQLQPNLVISTEYHFGIAAILAGAHRFAKVISWEHHHFYWLKRNRFWSFLLNRCYPKLNAVVCLNQQEVQYFEKFTKVVVIPNFAENRTGTHSDQESNLILSVCGLIPRKGIDLMLKAAKEILTANPGWKWKLIGDGELKEQVATFIAKEQLEGQFILQLPPGPNIENEYAAASLFVLTSRFEAFPMVLLEALSFGVPCVSTDCPTGPADIIDHNENGMLVKKEDEGGLINAISTLIKDENKRKRISENALESSKQYLPDRIYERWEKIF